MPLVALNLARNDIDDAGAVELAARWTRCYNLADIDLSANEITDTGAKHIGDSLHLLVSLV